MAGQLSALSQTFAGSKLEFYQQNDNTIRVRVYDTSGSAIFECIISSAEWTALKAALAGAGTSYTPSAELGPMGADHTVVIA